MRTTIRYTRPELLSLAPRPEEFTLSEEVLQKFSIIETECPVQSSSPDGTRHDATGQKSSDSKNGALGPASKRATNSERFAPPSRSWRGSRDQEAFEEGYKYELERNAIKKQALQETMEREKQRSDAAASSKDEGKNDTNKWGPSSPSRTEVKAEVDDEIERLMVSIAPGGEGGKKVAKSRFFSGANSGFQDTNPTSAPLVQAISEPLTSASLNQVKDPWALPSMVPASGNVVWNNVEASKPTGVDVAHERKNPSANVGMNSLLTGSLSLGVPSTAPTQHAGAVPTQPSMQPAVLHSVPAAPSVEAGAATSARAPATQPTETSASNQPRTWNAHDLEQRLISEQKVSRQPEVESKPIEATALEQQLLMQVKQSLGRPQTQPQAAVMSQMPGSAVPVTGAPPLLSVSGHMTPPQMSTTQLPAHVPQQQRPQQQPVQMPWGVPVQKVAPQQMQKLVQAPPQPQHRQTGVPQPVPIIVSGAQGAPYYAQPAMPGHYVAGFVPSQAQQPMMFYRPADGTAPYTVGATGFPPGTQVLFAQQQQAKQPNQRR
ncbi:hypothetical protein, conserved [Trypanosoma brucei gambiense DAL972]|uniref:4E-interacting protein n=1 Tax=Trypanosoma brucei gambiense (strain MHOM/CI/86/DAL972) TaxID=679716 RepID=C9ZYT0_TRYB9|nr:hypothetical protein, conserved [Trypanosoma brucei gambiense DAL972]CBH14579.1 hypothetical protein, conserved [Trypanosoma brucei gambiense DAL972]|eukprot:XP_011776845.1 hypothetical protein, conserved [Trypanosoma brucei gambiense DAL972]